MGKRKTHEEFIEEMKIKNPDIKILGEYKGNRHKIKCQCLEGHTWDTLALIILNGHGCPKCGGVYRRTHEEFIKEMEVINPNIEITGKYINMGTKIQCKCKFDKHIWEVTPKNLMKKRGCPKCGKNYRRTHQEFIDEMNAIDANIKILEEYKGANDKIKCECLIDKHIWDARPSSLLSGKGCPKCSGRVKTHDDFIKEMKIINPNIKVLGKYINCMTKIKCECVDGHIWDATPSSLLSGTGCPKCNFSKGEKIIENYCKNNYLQYISQYRIEKCRYKYTLPFDFALFNKDKLVALIEYQGKQHYEPVDFAGKGEEWAKKQFIINKKKDQIKRDYCLSNDIPLIEIPYWIEDVENYLDEQLDKIINKPMQLSLV